MRISTDLSGIVYLGLHLPRHLQISARWPHPLHQTPDSEIETTLAFSYSFRFRFGLAAHVAVILTIAIIDPFLKWLHSLSFPPSYPVPASLSSGLCTHDATSAAIRRYRDESRLS